MSRRRLQTLATLALPLQLPLARYDGALRGSGVRVRILAAGSRPTCDFVAGALLSDWNHEALEPLATPLGLRSAAFTTASQDADLVVADLPWLWRGLLPSQARLRFPAWVSQEIRAAPRKPLAVPTAVRKEAQRHMRREGYEVDVAGDEAVGDFYRDHYRPYIRQRFGAGALLVDEPRFRETARGMALARLLANGRWLAGLLFRVQGTTLELGWFGSREFPLPGGASEVLDDWVIGQAAERGARRAVMGHSRPSLADGVVRYKARFGAVLRATRFPQRVVGIEVRRPTGAVTAALNGARFVTFSGDGAEATELCFSPAP